MEGLDSAPSSVRNLSDISSTFSFSTHKCKSDNRESYDLSRSVFTRIFGLVLFFYFLSTFNNIIPLIGSNGIYPIHRIISAIFDQLYFDHDAIAFFKRVPLLFIILPLNDFVLRFLPFLGILLSFSYILTGVSNWIIGILTFLLLNTCVYSMNFFNFDISNMIILEVAFISIFLHQPIGFDKNSPDWKTPLGVRWTFRIFLFKVLFGSGVRQVLHSLSWSNLTGMHDLINNITSPSEYSYIFAYILLKPYLNKLITAFVIAIETVLSVFIVTPIRSCRIIAFVFTTLYSFLFFILGSDPHPYLLIFASSFFLLDDKILKYFFPSDSTENFYQILSNEDCADEEKDKDCKHQFVRCVKKLFDKLFYSTPKTEQFKLTFPLLGFKFGYSEGIKAFVDKLGSKGLFVLQLLLTGAMVLLLVFYNFLSMYFVVPLCILIHFITDLSDFLFAYITTFTTFIGTAVYVFKVLTVDKYCFGGLLFFIYLTLLVLSLSKSCEFQNTVERVYFNLLFLVITAFGFFTFLYAVFAPEVYPNSPILSYGINNFVVFYPKVSKNRYEIVIVGTEDDEITDDTLWKEYEWKSKPGYIDKAPCSILPYDRPFDKWASIDLENINYLLSEDNSGDELYKNRNHRSVGIISRVQLIPLFSKLTKGNKQIETLFKTNPFKTPPKHLKALVYSYFMSYKLDKSTTDVTHTQITEKKLNAIMELARESNYDPSLTKYSNYGNWWNRQPIKILSEFDSVKLAPNSPKDDARVKSSEDLLEDNLDTPLLDDVPERSTSLRGESSGFEPDFDDFDNIA